ncbi:hypothetical protein LTR37_017077 [Vermiconidia calcicola]|uniref:Uncharacterized protein n=1 Tax=Vermiconidia calcicola TaxID=1690605 RepID=A0ACC3MNS4_9PEZI|nr:hypothetical protein LTR37_017077 [Vermiconidia calcicola]
MALFVDLLQNVIRFLLAGEIVMLVGGLLRLIPWGLGKIWEMMMRCLAMPALAGALEDFATMLQGAGFVFGVTVFLVTISAGRGSPQRVTFTVVAVPTHASERQLLAAVQRDISIFGHGIPQGLIGDPLEDYSKHRQAIWTHSESAWEYFRDLHDQDIPEWVKSVDNGHKRKASAVVVEEGLKKMYNDVATCIAHVDEIEPAEQYLLSKLEILDRAVSSEGANDGNPSAPSSGAGEHPVGMGEDHELALEFASLLNDDSRSNVHGRVEKAKRGIRQLKSQQELSYDLCLVKRRERMQEDWAVARGVGGPVAEKQLRALDKAKRRWLY